VTVRADEKISAGIDMTWSYVDNEADFNDVVGSFDSGGFAFDLSSVAGSSREVVAGGKRGYSVAFPA